MEVELNVPARTKPSGPNACRLGTHKVKGSAQGRQCDRLGTARLTVLACLLAHWLTPFSRPVAIRDGPSHLNTVRGPGLQALEDPEVILPGDRDLFLGTEVGACSVKGASSPSVSHSHQS